MSADVAQVATNTHVQTLEVLEVIAETADAVSVILAVPDSLVRKFRYLPGQFLTVRVPDGADGSVARCYSLSSSPHLDDNLVVTVKRVPGGYASNWICDNLRAGDRLTVLSPSGKFVPRSLHQDMLLVGAGSGATPLLSIAKSVLIGGTATIYFFYANRSHDDVIFGSEIEEILMEFPDRFTVFHSLDDREGVPTVDGLAHAFRPFRTFDVYLCGPDQFMETARDAMQQVKISPEKIHTEIFQSLTGDPFADIVIPPFEDGTDAAEVIVELGGETHTLVWPREVALLDVLLSKGFDAPYSCREGACSACACTLRSGEVRMRKNDTLVDADLAAGLTLACQAVPVSDRVEIGFDQ
ncbi:3-ketosteroid 9alpha-hydroxylase component KshB [Gordonia effusa NBRC 100432]|uniref:3-ketosteroid 9alpha-hydroxylase component KshB n=1 Tax=Gordonia effusa NBRC 100432 TaxID=1077974 RepID=H0QXF4_9ACTN|nr:ferredoxin--NADP reductase [Gordonia effusa]GAB17505.1 3-ketosteroid 9alpha-hydroxylase component KshB [Gordonia effusa NBRC 100432]